MMESNPAQQWALGSDTAVLFVTSDLEKLSAHETMLREDGRHIWRMKVCTINLMGDMICPSCNSNIIPPVHFITHEDCILRSGSSICRMCNNSFAITDAEADESNRIRGVLPT